MNMHEHKYGSDMEEKYLIEKIKNDRAIEYIKECYRIYDIDDNAIQDILLNILNGDDKE